MGFPSRAEYERLVYGLADLDLSPPLPRAPNIKHNRKPAPGISFTVPNLPTLIADCLELGDSRPDAPR